ncbi:histidine phosphatase family protein [Oenococcus oeni]|uniref:histidine phosphatase family protein n=1 Tax=Oenococcus oeni TaxID=1247 RepID=UPI000A4707FD|nr:histidine phosphatase family protein [Oenococcus oeni]
MISIYFVRHALPDYSFDDDATMPLTSEGKRDSLKVLDKLNDVHFDFCLSSPYKRTIETILPLVKQLNLDLHTDPRLKERIRGGS